MCKMKLKLATVFVLVLACYDSHAQETLQTVTDRGNSTSNNLSINPIYQTGSRFKVWGSGSGSFDIFNNSNSSISLALNRSDGTSVFEVDGHSMKAHFAGNVGIGTPNPEAKLNINVGPGSANGTVGLRIGGNGNYPSLEFGIENDYDGIIKTFGNDLKIYAGNWMSVGAVASENHAIYFHTSKNGSANWSTPKMVLNSDGNLGIGISSPSEKLAVNGNIRAREVKVETANWPDYVFAKDYKFPSLSETEQHILAKGHLPGIPSAKDVETNGISLGDMNAKLLEKIEELTLIMIQLNKKVEGQTVALKQQQKELNSFKRKMTKQN